ncbi:MAG: hypothetical protein Edafosvirus6_21 [Edafosvirus sp.]|uniref:Uncharacterized protein n=1 Tax=Edafosvirus sp. TaxID=2487765 RepID=A0A3G4ZTE3_9VIRU|nr:MAG: hypothetical protein Edafosvirus6_21 [Edafosvirus sp.]
MPNDCCKFPPARVRRSINNTRPIVPPIVGGPNPSCLLRCLREHPDLDREYFACTQGCI